MRLAKGIPGSIQNSLKSLPPDSKKKIDFVFYEDERMSGIPLLDVTPVHDASDMDYNNLWNELLPLLDCDLHVRHPSDQRIAMAYFGRR